MITIKTLNYDNDMKLEFEGNFSLPMFLRPERED